jgi:chaperonin GroES
MTGNKIRPLHDRCIVKRLPEEEVTKGGMIQGEVVAVGPGKTLDNGKTVAPDVQVGNKVLFGKYAGSEVKLDGVEHLILREDEILAVLE